MASSSKTIDAVLDRLKCPICMDIPKDKVFQCVNGHIICEDCSSKLTTCPQCRVPFGSQHIRSLVIENMLDELTLECSYKDSGCQSNVGRKSFHNHLQSCYYNTTRFGPLVDVCQVLFGTKCAFLMNKGNSLEAIQHFQQEHRAAMVNSDNFLIHLSSEDLKKIEGFETQQPTIPEKYLDCRHKGIRLRATILKGNTGQHYFLILRILGKDGRTLSFASFFFRDYKSSDFDKDEKNSVSAQYKFKCMVENDEMDRLTWSVTPIDILSVEELPLYYDMPLASFLRKFSKDRKGININMKVKKIEKKP